MEAAVFVKNVDAFPPITQYHIPEDTVYNIDLRKPTVLLLLGYSSAVGEKTAVVFCFVTRVCNGVAMFIQM
jgi:hypothetical protein